MEEPNSQIISMLGHYFCHAVSLARVSHIENSHKNKLEDYKIKFLKNLEKIINLSENKNEKEQLNELFQITQKDWNDINTIKDLYKKYYEIKNEEYNEKEFF